MVWMWTWMVVFAFSSTHPHDTWYDVGVIYTVITPTVLFTANVSFNIYTLYNLVFIIIQTPSQTLWLKVCVENGQGSVTAVVLTRGGITPQPERSSVTTPVNGMAAGSSVTPGQLVPVGPRLLARDMRMCSSNRWGSLCPCVHLSCSWGSTSC